MRTEEPGVAELWLELALSNVCVSAGMALVAFALIGFLSALSLKETQT